jgi:hypothetical protein
MAKEDDASEVDFESLLISPPYVAWPWLYRGMAKPMPSQSTTRSGGPWVGPNVNHQINNEG